MDAAERQLSALIRDEGYYALLNVTGTLLQERFRRMNDPDDLSKALELFDSVTVAAAEFDQLLASTARANRAVCLSVRAAATGDLANMDEAVRDLEAASTDTCPESIRASRLDSLATVLTQLSDWRRDVALLSRAVTASETAVALTPPHASHRVLRTHNLAAVLRARYRATSSQSDLNRAIKLLEPLVRQLSRGELAAGVRTTAAACLRDRARATGTKTDLDRALQIQEQALRLAESDILRSRCRITLGSILVEKYETGGAIAELDRARLVYRDAFAQSHRDPETTVDAAKGWGLVAARQMRFDEAAAAFRAGIDKVAELFAQQIARSHKELWLTDLGVLANNGALAAARAGLPEDAVASMERGRAQLLMDALRLGSVELVALEGSGHADLRDRFRKAAATVSELQARQLRGSI